MILSAPPDKHISKLFLKIYAKSTKSDPNIWETLNRIYGKEIYFLLNLFAGQTIKFDSIIRLEDIKLMVKIVQYMEETIDGTFEEKVKFLAEKYNTSTNKIFQLYEEYQSYFDKE